MKRSFIQQSRKRKSFDAPSLCAIVFLELRWMLAENRESMGKMLQEPMLLRTSARNSSPAG
jgi:hypothetical protein